MRPRAPITRLSDNSLPFSIPLPSCPPHINAHPGDFAETVLMLGDPLRAEFISRRI